MHHSLFGRSGSAERPRRCGCAARAVQRRLAVVCCALRSSGNGAAVLSTVVEMDDDNRRHFVVVYDGPLELTEVSPLRCRADATAPTHRPARPPSCD
jgi:hypothetical protein